MPKKYFVRAMQISYFTAVVEVPDDWTVEDLEDWYEYNGSSGEFEEHHAEWDFVWDWTSEADPNTPISISFVDTEGKEKVA